MQEIILPENIFGCPFKFILEYSMFMVINQNIDTHMKNHHDNMNYFEMDYSFFLFKFVSNKCYLSKSDPTKVMESFFIF